MGASIGYYLELNISWKRCQFTFPFRWHYPNYSSLAFYLRIPRIIIKDLECVKFPNLFPKESIKGDLMYEQEMPNKLGSDADTSIIWPYKLFCGFILQSNYDNREADTPLVVPYTVGYFPTKSTLSEQAVGWLGESLSALVLANVSDIYYHMCWCMCLCVLVGNGSKMMRFVFTSGPDCYSSVHVLYKQIICTQIHISHTFEYVPKP